MLGFQLLGITISRASPKEVAWVMSPSVIVKFRVGGEIVYAMNAPAAYFREASPDSHRGKGDVQFSDPLLHVPSAFAATRHDEAVSGFVALHRAVIVDDIDLPFQ